MSRYVILHHVTPPDSPRAAHWDLMLEFGDSLRTWALPSAPEVGQTQTVEALPPHRLAYLDYVGPISGDRGQVTQWDGGTFELLDESESRVNVLLRGQGLTCRATLVRSTDAPDRWALSLEVR